MKKYYLLFIFISLLTVCMHAQVTIGSNEEPEQGSLLQLKEMDNVVLDAPNANKGLGLPRVTLSDKNELYPMFLKNPTDPTSGPNDTYATNKISLDKTHTGLIVYNLEENEDKDLCLGMNQWDGEQWSCFQQKPTTAQFTLDCNAVKVMGDYGDGIALNTSNYIKISITVTRIGAYSISAAAKPDNGYFFEITGTFYSTGTYSVTIPGTGQPVKHTQGANLVDPSDDTPDQFTIVSSGGGTDCNFSVNVRSTAAHPEYSIDCAATVVEGMYFEDQPLSSTPNPTNGQSNRIKVTLKNIPASAYGSVAMLETNSVDGFSFKGEAVLMSSTQDIYLTGTGTPRGLTDKIFTITSNSESSTASCTTTVYMLIPHKRLMTLGNTNASYGYNLGLPTSRTNATTGYNSGNDLLTDKDNFGYNQWSIMKFSGFSNRGTASSANQPSGNINSWVDDNRDIICLETSVWRAMTAQTLEKFLLGTNTQSKVDIFMIGYNTEYFRNNNADDAAKAEVLSNFIKTGGILMICSEENESNANFMNKIFNTTNITSTTGAGAGSLYTLGFNSMNMPDEYKPYYCKDDDPILKGPFEDIVGRHWGEDASTTKFLTNLPLDDIVIYSGAREIGNTSRNAAGVTIFRHREYPLVFIGDGGFNSNESRGYTGHTVCPFTLTTKTIKGRVYKSYPTYRPKYNDDNGRAYNAVFTANAFAWCILKAEEYRRANK